MQGAILTANQWNGNSYTMALKEWGIPLLAWYLSNIMQLCVDKWGTHTHTV